MNRKKYTIKDKRKKYKRKNKKKHKIKGGGFGNTLKNYFNLMYKSFGGK